MRKIFIDTDALVALNDSSDLLHKKALKILEKISRFGFVSFLSTNVLLETLTIISQKMGKKQAILLLEELRSGKYTIIHPNEKLIFVTEEIFKSIKSKNVSYSDCLSFAVAGACDIEWVFSFDVHFKKQGFKRFGIERVETEKLYKLQK